MPALDLASTGDIPSVAELLEVDAEFRAMEADGRAPVLHAVRGERRYTAGFSDTPRAQRLGKTRDWVVVDCFSTRAEQHFTVITSQLGDLHGRRVVRGREAECGEFYRQRDRARAHPRVA